MQHIKSKLTMLFAFLLLGWGAQAQITCSFTVDKVKVCLGDQLTFTPSPTKAANANVKGYRWHYGDGASNTQDNPNYQYTKPGVYQPKLTVYLNNGDSCVTGSTMPFVTVFPKPRPDYKLSNGHRKDTQCYEGNNFCLTDLSLPDSVTNAKIIRRIILWDDGSYDSTGADWPNNKFVCHTYFDSVGRWRSPKLIVTDTNGCIAEFKIDSDFLVLDKIGARFTTQYVVKCDSTPVTYSNGSSINPNVIEYFEWDFGDGTKFKSSSPPTGPEKAKYWNNFVHMYYKSGPFAATLRIKSLFGCIDQYTNPYAGNNINLGLDPTVLDDTMCWGGHLMEFNSTPLFTPIPGQQQVYWFYLHPPPNNVDSGTWQPSHVYPSCGPKKVLMLVWQPPCQKLDSVDSMMLYGPQATIESPPGEIADTERHQCRVINTVHFPNHSKICDAIHIQFYWDFDDNSNNQSKDDTAICAWANLKDTLTIHYDGDKQKYDTTSTCFLGIPMPFLVKAIVYINTKTAKNLKDPTKIDTFVNYRIYYRNKNCTFTVNGVDTTWKALNTHYSYDWVPEHKYDTTHIKERCHTPKFVMKGEWYKYDTIMQAAYAVECNSMAQVPLALMNPDASYLKTEGKNCYTVSPPPYNITFKWDKSKPGCTQQFVSICFDSSCCAYPADPACWTRQTSFSVPPWSLLPPWPTQYKRSYSPLVCDSSGWVTLGFAIQNRKGEYDSTIRRWCSDTFWFHHRLRFVPGNALFYTNQNITGNYDCPWSYVMVHMVDTVQDSIVSIGWNWGDGHVTADTIARRPYKRMRYEFDEFGGFTSKDITAILPDTIVPTMYHQYPKRGVYYISVTLINTDSCYNSVRKNGRILIGNMAELYTDDTILCNTKNATQFTHFIRYWDPLGPPFSYFEWNDWDYWADPTVSPNPPYTRPKPAGGYETFLWLFGDPVNPSSKADTAYHTFSDTGIYDVRLLTKDSLGCRDTIHQNIYVNDVTADFKTSRDTLYCGQLINFLDLSYTWGPCKSQNKCKDIIVSWFWEFGDNTNPSILQNPTHQYTSNGLFTVKLIVRSTTGCWDTISKQIRVIGPLPKCKVLTDTLGCAPFSVTFDNLSDTISKNFIWRFNHKQPNGTFKTVSEATQSDSNFTHVFTEAGIYHITLTSSGAIYDPTTGTNRICEATYPDTVNGFQRPIVVYVLRTPQARFFNQPIACVGDKVPFINFSDTELVFLNYDFGDGTALAHDTSIRYRDSTKVHKVSEDTTWHVFTRAGKYTILFTPKTHLCPDDTFGVIIIDSVKANFGWDPTVEVPKFHFLDSSSGNVTTWRWDFGNPRMGSANTSTSRNPEVDYDKDTGTFNVCLYVTNGRCTDSICKKVVNNFDVDVIIPNSFTPDGDGINDGYFCETKGLSSKDSTPYELWIFNRWGERVFHTTDPKEQWNGKNQNDGSVCPEGTYFFNFKWKLRAWKEPVKEKNFYEQTFIESQVGGKPWGSAKGTITLLRKN